MHPLAQPTSLRPELSCHRADLPGPQAAMLGVHRTPLALALLDRGLTHQWIPFLPATAASQHPVPCHEETPQPLPHSTAGDWCSSCCWRGCRPVRMSRHMQAAQRSVHRRHDASSTAVETAATFACALPLAPARPSPPVTSLGRGQVCSSSSASVEAAHWSCGPGQLGSGHTASESGAAAAPTRGVFSARLQASAR